MKLSHFLVPSKRGVLVWTFFWMLFSTTICLAQEIITLQRAMELALKNNLQVKQAELTERLSDETFKQSKWALYPTLNGVNNNVGWNYGRSVNLTTNQFVDAETLFSNINLSSAATLFQGFQKLNQIAQNKYLLEADKSSTQKAKNDLILSVLTTYLQVLGNQDILLAAKQQLDYSLQQMDREQKFFDVGNKTVADLSQAKAQLANAELNVTNAQNQLDISLLNLAQLLERDPELPFKVEKPMVEAEKTEHTNYSAADIYRNALRNFPEIQQAKNRSLALYKGIDIAKGGLYPTITLQASLDTKYSNVGSPDFTSGAAVYAKAPSFYDQSKSNFNQTVVIGLNIPIFNGFSARSAIKSAKVKYENAKMSEQLAKNNLNKIINQAVLDVQAAEKKYNSTQAAYAASKDAFDATEKRYLVGLVNSLDYNKAQTDLNNAQFEVIKAEYDLIFRRKTIDFYLSKCLGSNGCK